MTSDEVRAILRQQIEGGTARAWSQRHGVSEAYVNSVVAGRNDPGPAILDVLGLEKVVSYEPKAAP